ncbi:MAG: hypothetical protein ACT4P7_03190 [Gemmatimonadaceae bacterium]
MPNSGGELVRFEPGPGRFKRYPLPFTDALPYVVRADPRNGRLWIGSGAADVVLSFDPTTSRFTTYPLPSRGAMVRHITVDARNGDVWLAYGASPGRIPSRVARLRPGR